MFVHGNQTWDSSLAGEVDHLCSCRQRARRIDRTYRSTWSKILTHQRIDNAPGLEKIVVAYDSFGFASWAPVEQVRSAPHTNRVEQPEPAMPYFLLLGAGVELEAHVEEKVIVPCHEDLCVAGRILR